MRFCVRGLLFRFHNQRCRDVSEAERSQDEHRTVTFLQWNNNVSNDDYVVSRSRRYERKIKPILAIK